MLIRFKLLITLCVFVMSNLVAQNYHSDSLDIKIKSKNNFIVNDYSDLNIDIIYLAGKKKQMIYKQFESAYRSVFGNCFFELYTYDSASGSYRNITLEVSGGTHPPKDFKSEDEIWSFDLEKQPLGKGKEKVLTFNLIDFLHALPKGVYSLKIFLRTGNIYGYDSQKHIVTNSIIYLESSVMNFEASRNIYTPNKIK